MSNIDHAEPKERALVEKYPTLFRQWHLDAFNHCMGRGIEVQEGWYPLIDELAAEISLLAPPKDDPDFPQYEFGQIKQKFGLLRVYMDPHTEEVAAVVSKYESRSEHVCERCGSTDGAGIRSGGWMAARCFNCFRNDHVSGLLYLYNKLVNGSDGKPGRTHENAMQSVALPLVCRITQKNATPDDIEELCKWSQTGTYTDPDVVARIRAAADSFKNNQTVTTVSALASLVSYHEDAVPYHGAPRAIIIRTLRELGYKDEQPTHS